MLKHPPLGTSISAWDPVSWNGRIQPYGGTTRSPAASSAFQGCGSGQIAQSGQRRTARNQCRRASLQTAIERQRNRLAPKARMQAWNSQLKYIHFGLEQGTLMCQNVKP